jgi:glutathione synthase/RimK-type ligase-like ATP-grasp enzyme
MLNNKRLFVDVVKRYCADHGIAIELRSQGWLIMMQHGQNRHFAYGYDVGLNSGVTHRIANDKAATAEILEAAGIAHVAHRLFLRPELSEFIPAQGSWTAMIELLAQNPMGLVVKPNEGTSGKRVFRVRDKLQLELATNAIFSANLNLAISPYLAIDDEVRVVLVDAVPMIVYSKHRPSIVGDGNRSVLELILTEMPAAKLSALLHGTTADDLDQAVLEAVIPAGQRQTLNWRHNLESGAEPVLLLHGATRDACVELAIRTARAMNLRFGSIDVVQVDGAWRVLEVNSGVVMEALGKRHPELVHAAYRAALDKVFGESGETTLHVIPGREQRGCE